MTTGNFVIVPGSNLTNCPNVPPVVAWALESLNSWSRPSSPVTTATNRLPSGSSVGPPSKIRTALCPYS